jgi:uncharacterized protein (DUF433 family)
MHLWKDHCVATTVATTYRLAGRCSCRPLLPPQLAKVATVAAGPPYHRWMAFQRITVDPDLMGGVPTIRGLRIPVATVVSMVADGMSVAEICADLPDLTPADVAEALRYAAETVRERQLPLRTSA